MYRCANQGGMQHTAWFVQGTHESFTEQEVKGADAQHC
jgi:hypothetical protein